MAGLLPSCEDGGPHNAEQENDTDMNVKTDKDNEYVENQIMHPSESNREEWKNQGEMHIFSNPENVFSIGYAQDGVDTDSTGASANEFATDEQLDVIEKIDGTNKFDTDIAIKEDTIETSKDDQSDLLEIQKEVAMQKDGFDETKHIQSDVRDQDDMLRNKNSSSNYTTGISDLKERLEVGHDIEGSQAQSEFDYQLDELVETDFNEDSSSKYTTGTKVLKQTLAVGHDVEDDKAQSELECHLDKPVETEYNMIHEFTEEIIQFDLHEDTLEPIEANLNSTMEPFVVNREEKVGHHMKPGEPMRDNFLTANSNNITEHKYIGDDDDDDDDAVIKPTAVIGDVDEILGETWLTRNDKTYISNASSNLPSLRRRNLDTSYTSDNNAFSCLPDELHILIFSYLSTYDLCLCVASVCSKWHQLSRDHSLWKTLDFSMSAHLSTLNFLWVLRRAPLLRRLIVSGRVHLTHAEVSIMCECCPGLREIDFGFCDNLNCDIIRCISESCPQLVSLNVEGCDKVDHSCLRFIAKCKNLTRMNFSHCIPIQDAGISFLAKNMKRIVGLNLDGMNFLTDISVIDLVKYHKDHLEELELDGAEISDEGIEYVAQCKHLKHFGMSFSECLTDKSLQSLKACSNLQYLRLRKGSDLTPEGLSTFFQEAHLTKLTHLNLSECTCINDNVVLLMVLMCGKTLRELSLSWCWYISDKGIISIVDHCCLLESLDLLGIDKIVGESLDRIPEDMPHLKFLDLRQCNKIQDSLICDVVRRKPDLKVINYYGEEFVHD